MVDGDRKQSDEEIGEGGGRSQGYLVRFREDALRLRIAWSVNKERQKYAIMHRRCCDGMALRLPDVFALVKRSSLLTLISVVFEFARVASNSSDARQTPLRCLSFLTYFQTSHPTHSQTTGTAN